MDRYQKMYAYLVGQVDDTLEMIGAQLARQGWGYDEMVAVVNKLQNALTTAEEMYLKDGERY